MKMRIRFEIWDLVIILGIVAIVALLRYRPLVPAGDWEASSPQAGSAEVYKMLFESDRLYLKFPNAEDKRNLWYALDLGNRFAAQSHWPKSEPYLHMNRGMSLGIGLSGMKIGEPWDIAWGANESSFRSSYFQFTLRKSGANKASIASLITP